MCLLKPQIKFSLEYVTFLKLLNESNSNIHPQIRNILLTLQKDMTVTVHTHAHARAPECRAHTYAKRGPLCHLIFKNPKVV